MAQHSGALFDAWVHLFVYAQIKRQQQEALALVRKNPVQMQQILQEVSGPLWSSGTQPYTH